MAQQQDRKGTHTPATPSPTSEDTLVQAGLDPALAAALLQQNPLAVQAVAGLVDNSLIAESLGLNREQAPAAAASQSTPSPSSDGEIAGEQETEEKDPAQERPGQGSGEHGRLDPTAADYASVFFWRGVAQGASDIGLKNAGAHMHHYLENTGTDKEVDLDAIERDVPSFRTALHELRFQVLEDAAFFIKLNDSRQPFSWEISQWGFGGQLSKAESPDWYYAVAGHDLGLNATAWYNPSADDPGRGLLQIEGRTHFKDVYDWDEGKETDILGVTVRDSDLGRLHAAGLAMEYPIWGSRPFSLTVQIDEAQGGPTGPVSGTEVEQGTDP